MVGSTKGHDTGSKPRVRITKNDTGGREVVALDEDRVVRGFGG